MTDKKKNNEEPEIAEESMTVTMTLDDGSQVDCSIVTILTMGTQDYIVLLPLDENGENTDGEVWIYRYYEDVNDPDKEPELEYIEDDEEYEKISDLFDEFLDNAEFDELIPEDEDKN